MVIEIEDKTRERVSRDRVVLAPSPSGVIISPGGEQKAKMIGNMNMTRVKILRHFLGKQCSME